jgi:hypothetical protein
MGRWIPMPQPSPLAGEGGPQPALSPAGAGRVRGFEYVSVLPKRPIKLVSPRQADWTKGAPLLMRRVDILTKVRLLTWPHHENMTVTIRKPDFT